MRCLPLAVAALLVAAGAAPAVAAPQDGVSLPVVPGRLAAGAACTGASPSVASALPWQQQSLGLDRVRQSGDGSGVTVAVIDTGVSTGAPALAGRVRALGAGGRDCVGHGTFVAGIVAAARTGGVRFAGVAPRARILAVRGTDERGDATPGSVAAGIRSAARAGAQVIEVSAALDEDSAALASAAAYAARQDALVVAAAVPDPDGRATSTATPPRAYWPAALPGVLSVVDLDAVGGRPAGAAVPLGADLAAPGDGVISVGPRGHGHYLGAGASFAAAFVAGTAALIRAAHPELSAARTAARLTDTAYPANVPRLDPWSAVTAVGDAATPPAARVAAPVSLRADPATARAAHRAVVTAGLAAGLLLLTAWAAVVVRVRRNRTPRAL